MRPWHAKYYKSPAAGLWRQVPAHRWPEAFKTKAHRTKKQARRENDLEDWEGNRRTDLAAKAAALRGEPPTILEDIAGFRKKDRAALRAILAVIAFYPKLELPRRPPKP